MMRDIEIAQRAEKEDIRGIASKLGISADDLILYGYDKAKIKTSSFDKKAKLVLVTAVNPTPYGEGKTTVSIGLGDALSMLDNNPVVVLREPSMGPVFGIKGGATGGGYSQVIPMEDINLHFTGDFHAITAANDLLCAAIDNHIFHGNQLDISDVVFKRCLDVNDRALRKVFLNDRSESFSITAASEIMAIFCLASSLEDLKRRLGNIVIGYNSSGKCVYARDLNIEGALTVILKDAFLPNLVQTLEHTPVIIHGGPFANIAHGCNTVVATKLGMSLGDYVITEAGFGADLGAEKFFDIKCRKAGIVPDCTVLVATLKSLKYNGGVSKDCISEENYEALSLGLENLGRHIENLKKYGVSIVVCLNKYANDLDSEIKLVEEYCQKYGVLFSISTAYIDGGCGAIDLAKKVVQGCLSKNHFELLYEDSLPLDKKIEKICKEIYRAKKVEYSVLAREKLERLASSCSQFPVCIAKTPYSFSDDPKKLGAPCDFSVMVQDVFLYNGAEFVTVLLGDIVTMPGLPVVPNYEKIDLVDDLIVGLD
ncbi:MAG: formate--tetrahydrofolate ligase [bacterium]|nr:formate--tetrahydrofolate ligase [bacterium]